MERPSAQRKRTTGSHLLALPPGELIPGTRYRIVARVGSGAMGAVYQAEHVDLEKRVALKTLLAASARDPKAIERFRQEARAASKIGSPFICDVTDFGQLPDGQVFFVMEYIEGESLRHVLDADKVMDPTRAIPILRQVCKALGAALDKGIIHLDVKPDNVMLSTSKRRGDMVKMVDFGIAGLNSAGSAPEGGGSEDRVVGTPDYLSPERIRGKGYDLRSDIYSLGATAYEMLTGSCPFWHEDVMTTLARHITDKPVPMRQRVPDLKIPAELDHLVLQMLAKSPDERPQNMAVVEAMLCEAQIATSVQTEWDDLELPPVDEDWQKKLAEGMPSPRSRRLRRLAVALGAVALLGLGLSLYFGLRRPKTIVAYTPVYVEVTKTDEADAVAPWLRKASLAAGTEHFLEPAHDSALHFIEQAEREAKNLGTSSSGALSLRQLYGNQFRTLGNALREANLNDLATLRYREALRFLPGDAELRARLGSTPSSSTRAQEEKPGEGARPTSAPRANNPAEVAAADLFSTVNKGQFSRARIALARLLETDDKGNHGARLADEFRKRAQTLWDNGKRDEARPYYQIVSALDTQDTVANERANSVEPVAIVPPPAPLDNGDDTAAGKTAKKRAEEENVPRDRKLSAKAVKEGTVALARGDLAKAQMTFQRAVNADPTNPEALFGMAEVAFENARYTDALDYGRRAVKTQPKNPRYQVVMGDAYFKLLRLEEARAAYRRAQALAPNDGGIAARIERVDARLNK